MNKAAGLPGLLLLLAAGVACAADPAAAGRERSAAQDEAIAFWSAGYTGADLSGGDFGCPPPTLPALPHADPHTGTVSQAISRWEQCHEEFMAALGATSAEVRIPADVLAWMTPAERSQARAHVQAVQARIAADAQAHATATMARHAAWRGATVEHIVQEHVMPDSRHGAVRKAKFTPGKK